MPVPDAALQSLAERVRPVELRSEQPPFPVVPGLATLLPNGLTRGTTVSVGAAPGIGGALTLALALAAAPSRSGAWTALVDPPPPNPAVRGGASAPGGPSAPGRRSDRSSRSNGGPGGGGPGGGGAGAGGVSGSVGGVSDRRVSGPGRSSDGGGASGSGGGRAGASRGPGGGGPGGGSSGPGDRAGADPGDGSGLPGPSSGRGPVARRSVRGGAVPPPPGPVAGGGSSRRPPGGRAPAPPSGPAEVAWGLVAASGLGVALERVVVVAPETPPASGWGPVLAALIDGFPIVVVGPRVQLRAGDGRRLAARLRERGGVLIRVGDASATSSAHVRLRVVEGEWEGVDEGAGYLRSRRVVVEAGGRGAASRPRRAELLLPSPTGEITLAPPTPLHPPTPAPGPEVAPAVVGGASSASHPGFSVAGAPEGEAAPAGSSSVVGGAASSGSVPGRPLRPAVPTGEASGGPVRRHSRARRHRRRSSVPASRASDAPPVGGGRVGAGV